MLLQQPPPMPVHQFNAQDEAHLKIISVCHYVMGGFYLLGIGFVILHFIIMSMVFRMSEANPTASASTTTSMTVDNPLFPFPDRLSSVFSALDEKANS